MAEQGKETEDLKKKKIIADYIETENYSETGRRNNVSNKTVSRLIEKNPEVVKLVKEKKEKNTQTVLEEMEKMTDKKINILKLAMSEMERLLIDKKVTPNSLATIYGVLLDKELKHEELKLKDKELNSDKQPVHRIEIVNDLPRDDE